jgi:hypothetical protein
LARAFVQASEGKAPDAISLEASDATFDAESLAAPLPDAAALELEDAQDGGS